MHPLPLSLACSPSHSGWAWSPWSSFSNAAAPKAATGVSPGDRHQGRQLCRGEPLLPADRPHLPAGHPGRAAGPGLRPVPDAATLKNPPTVHFATMTGAFAGAGRPRLPYRTPLFQTREQGDAACQSSALRGAGAGDLHRAGLRELQPTRATRGKPRPWPVEVAGTRGDALPAQWWTLYQDPGLNHLVAAALRHNRDLAAADAHAARSSAICAAHRANAGHGPRSAMATSMGATATTRPSPKPPTRTCTASGNTPPASTCPTSWTCGAKSAPASPRRRRMPKRRKRRATCSGSAWPARPPSPTSAPAPWRDGQRYNADRSACSTRAWR